MLVSKLLASFFVLLAVLADDDTGLQIYKKTELGVMACESLLGKTALYFKKKDKVGYCNVKNQPALGAMAHCLKEIPNPGSIDYFLKECKKFNLTEEKFLAAFDNATNYLVTNTSLDPTFNLTKIYNKPVLIPKKKILNGYKSAQYRFLNFNWSTWFGTALVAYWFFIVFVAGACNLAYFLFPKFVHSITSKPVNAFRKYISLPATFKKDHVHHKSYLYIFQFLIPTRLESILIFGWFIMALAFNIAHIDYTDGDLYWPKSKSANVGRKIADRSGMLALFLMPQVILFSGRNNFLQWISGWSYSRFSLLHRWCSRIMTIISFLHGVGMKYNGMGIGKWYSRNDEPYVRWGFVALAAACVLCFQSLLVFRRSNYELFLLFHILLAVFFVVGVWRHAGSSDLGYIQWSYASVAIWGFDRVVRLARLASFGVKPASVQLIADETLRVEIQRPKYWKPYPGCHAFIHFLRPTCFWQSHPFTIIDSVDKENTITFYLKVKGGITHGLYQYLSKQPDNKAVIKVMVEGPYGNRSPIRNYPTSVFIAGGNGIPGLYSQVQDITKSQGQQRVKLYWIIRHYKTIEWFYPELLKLESTNVETVIYVTQPHVGLDGPIGGFATGPIDESADVDADDSEKKPDSTSDDDDLPEDHISSLKNQLSSIEFREGRPEIETLIKTEIAEANGAIGFVTCAHANLVDEARRTVANNLSTEKRVDLFEQIQSW